MIRLTPTVDLRVECPQCRRACTLGKFSITGVHNSVEARCELCGSRFEQEMPVNCGLFYPALIDAETGLRRDTLPFTNWFLAGLTDAYRARKHKEVSFQVERFRKRSRPRLAILNTIDHCYGHSLFELFNAQHYLSREDTDLIVIVQQPLRWLVPDGVAEVWTVGVPFKEGGDWNTWLAERIRQEIQGHDNVYLCRAFVQADSSDFDIERFTKIAPFPLDKWDERLVQPTVTFIWRADRFWRPLIPRLIDNRHTRRFVGPQLKSLQLEIQRYWITALAETLRESIPNLDFGVAGMDDRRHAFPSWIKDYRHPVHTDETAREMASRYARSHVVVGCNGSSLVLPSAMAGAVVNLVPGDHWAVSEGSFVFRITDVGDTHFRYVMLPSETVLSRVASVVKSIVRDRSLIQLHTANEWRNHEVSHDTYDWGRFRVRAFNNVAHVRDEGGLVTTSRRGSAQPDVKS